MRLDMDNVFVNGWVVEALGRAGLISSKLKQQMSRTPFLAHMYARLVQHGRWPEGEPQICLNQNIAYQYARLVLKLEMRDAERWGYEYCKDHHIRIPQGQYVALGAGDLEQDSEGVVL